MTSCTEPNWVDTLCNMLFALYALRQPLLSSSITEVLRALCVPSSSMPATSMADLLLSVLKCAPAWELKGSENLLGLVSLLEDGFVQLNQLDPAACASNLPRAVRLLVSGFPGCPPASVHSL